MADTARDPAPESTDFQELEDGEDLFPEPAASQEVRKREEVIKGGRGELWQAGRQTGRQAGKAGKQAGRDASS